MVEILFIEALPAVVPKRYRFLTSRVLTKLNYFTIDAKVLLGEHFDAVENMKFCICVNLDADFLANLI